MQRPDAHFAIHGVVGGVVAGAIIALWFLVVDLLGPGAFHTPAVLAGMVLNREVTEPTVRLVVTYSIVHFGVFTFLGAAAVWVMRLVGVQPGLLLGALFGVGVLNGVHYGALLVTGAAVLTTLPIFHVLGANLVGGMAMMAYLHRSLHSESPLGPMFLKGYPLLTKGIVTGLIGAAAVALWFFLLDIAVARPFYTPGALGSALLLGVSDTAEIQINAGVVIAYTVVHLAAFAFVGTGFVWLAERLIRSPGIWLIVLMSFIVLEGLFIATAGSLSEWVMEELAWWAIVVGNLIAVAVMGLHVWNTHPELRKKLLEEPVETRI
ncbi:MAG: hypothetical protein V3R24_04910 [Gemmatimonadales bacterium]